MNLSRKKSLIKLINICAAVGVISISQNAYSQIVNANFNWSGSNNFSVTGNFVFDNDITFMNQVTEDNGALKSLSWSAFNNGIEVYSESVVSNSITSLNNQFFDFNYSVTENKLIFIDTGASENWYTNNLIYPNNFFTSVLELDDVFVSSNEMNAKVDIGNTISPVPLPSSLMLFGITLFGMFGGSFRKMFEITFKKNIKILQT